MISLINSYRPAHTAKHLYTVKDFLLQFRELLSEVILEAYPCYNVGDFNIRLETLDNLVSSGSVSSSEQINYTNAVSCLRLLSDMEFCQQGKDPTHNQNDTLDFAITQIENVDNVN